MSILPQYHAIETSSLPYIHTFSHAQLQTGTDAFKAQGQADLMKSQQLERSDLEKQLLEEEKLALENLAADHDHRQKDELDKLNRKLALKLEGELSEKEVRGSFVFFAGSTELQYTSG